MEVGENISQMFTLLVPRERDPAILTFLDADLGSRRLWLPFRCRILGLLHRPDLWTISAAYQHSLAILLLLQLLQLPCCVRPAGQARVMLEMPHLDHLARELYDKRRRRCCVSRCVV